MRERAVSIGLRPVQFADQQARHPLKSRRPNLSNPRCAFHGGTRPNLFIDSAQTAAINALVDALAARNVGDRKLRATRWLHQD